MDSDPPPDGPGGRRLVFESYAAFVASLAFVLALAPTGPFTKELGVCESGAVRDVLSGNVILPHYAPGTLVQVPPMYWWAAALAVHVAGWSEMALRAPSLLAVAATGAILYAWAASSMSCKAARWTMPALLSAQYVADAARQPRMDALLMMFLTAAMVCLERALSALPRPPVGADARRVGMLLSCAALAMGGAILTKGPLGAILPGLTLAIFFAMKRRLWELLRLDVIATFAGAIAIGGLWYLAAFEAGGHEFFEFQIAHGLFGRFLGAAAGVVGECQNPFYYYIPRLVFGFLPWSLFYPALVVVLWRERASTPAPVTFALCWFMTVLGFFTISAGKCLVYILPLFPALAAMTGWLIANIAEQPRDSDPAVRFFDWASIAIGTGVLAIIAALGGLTLSGSGAMVAAHLHRSDRQFLELLIAAVLRGSPGVVLWITLWLLGGTLMLISIVRNRRFDQCFAVALIAIAGTLLWYGFLNPALASEHTLKPFAAVVDRTVPPGIQIDYIGQPDCDLAFYSDHAIGSLKNFRCAMEPNRYFIVWQDHLSSLAPAQRSCLQPIAQSAAVDSHGARVLMIER